jgi:UDP:flavonoid glycosyltransferase YjiC (YdhE family)
MAASTGVAAGTMAGAGTGAWPGTEDHDGRQMRILFSATPAAGHVLPLVPLADQPWTARRVARAGAALVIDDPAEAGPAVRTVLTDPRYRTAAQDAAVAIRSMPTPEAALGDLLARAGLSDPA